MSLDGILERIGDEARLRCEEILNQAREKREAILAEARNKGGSEAAAILKRGHDEARARCDRAVTLAQLESRKRLLGSKQEVIETAFARALQSLADLPDDRYEELLKGIILATATGEEEVIFSQRDCDRLGRNFINNVNRELRALKKTGKLRLSQETRPMTGGFILRGDRVEVNASFDMTLALIRDELEPEVAAVLFGTGPGEG